MVESKMSGCPRRGLDTIIATIAVADGRVVITDYERDFAGIEIINLLRGAPATKHFEGD